MSNRLRYWLARQLADLAEWVEPKLDYGEIELDYGEIAMENLLQTKGSFLADNVMINLPLIKKYRVPTTYGTKLYIGDPIAAPRSHDET